MDDGEERIWGRQRRRNLADCRMAGLTALTFPLAAGSRKSIEELIALMQEGLAAVARDADDADFYRRAGALGRGCAEACAGDAGDVRNQAPLFRIYAAVFEEMGKGVEISGGAS